MSPSIKTTSDGFLRGSRTDGSLARRSLYLIVGSFFLTLLALSLLGENGLGSWVRLHGQEQRLKNDVADLEHQNDQLQGALTDLEDDPDALEKMAREVYNMQKPGEEILIILPAESAEAGGS
jgi:cell division protein FtsB